MVDQKKIKELEQIIENKTKELQKAEDSRKAAEKDGNTSLMVLQDKKIEMLKNDIKAIQSTKAAVEYVPPMPTSVEVLVSGLNKYIEAKAEKVNKIVKEYNGTVEELEKEKALLEDATAAGVVDKVVEHSKRIEELKVRIGYIKEMISKTENSKTFPEGAIVQEWEKVCDEHKADFDNIVNRISLLAEEYKKACNEFAEMVEDMRGAQRKMRVLGSADGHSITFPTILTVGLDVESMVISKVEGFRPRNILNTPYGEKDL